MQPLVSHVGLQSVSGINHRLCRKAEDLGRNRAQKGLEIAAGKIRTPNAAVENEVPAKTTPGLGK